MATDPSQPLNIAHPLSVAVPHSDKVTVATSATAIQTNDWYTRYQSVHWSDLLALPSTIATIIGAVVATIAVIYGIRGYRLQRNSLPSASPLRIVESIPTIQTSMLGRGKSTAFSLHPGDTYSEDHDEGWSVCLVGFDRRKPFPRARLRVFRPSQLTIGSKVVAEKKNQFLLESSVHISAGNSLGECDSFLDRYRTSTLFVTKIDTQSQLATLRLIHIVENAWPLDNSFTHLSSVDYKLNITSHSNGAASGFPLTVSGTIEQRIPPHHELWLFTVDGLSGYVPQGTATVAGLRWHFRADNEWMAPGRQFTFKMFLLGPDGVRLANLYRGLNDKISKSSNGGWKPLSSDDLTADSRPLTINWTIYKDPMKSS